MSVFDGIRRFCMYLTNREVKFGCTCIGHLLFIVYYADYGQTLKKEIYYDDREG